MSPQDYIRQGHAVGSAIRHAQPMAAHVAVPSRASSRAVARAVQRNFKAGEDDRLAFGWTAIPTTADSVIHRHQRVLVARSREQATNNDHAKAFIRLCRQNIVGPNGVMLQAQARSGDGKLDMDLNKGLEAAWGEWGHRNNCDVTAQESWRSLQISCIISAAKDGEFLLRKIYGPEAGPWGFSLQIIDPVRLPVDYDVQSVNGGTNFIRHGIEFTKYGRPVAYHLIEDDTRGYYYEYGGRSYVRVPVDEIIHGFRKDMVGQKRGLPWMATALYSMRHLNGYEEAAIINARVGASKMGFVRYEAGQEPEDYEEEEQTIDIEPGILGQLPPGAKLEKWDPQFPAGDFQPFTKHMLRKMAAGMGTTYADLAADLEGVNFSSIRQGTLDSREGWKELQEWLIEQLIQPVFEAWLPYSLLAGRIRCAGRVVPASRVTQCGSVSWQPRRWDWIDPRADNDANVSAKNNFLKSPSEIIRTQGREPSAVWVETASDLRAQVDALMAEGFTEDQALELVKIGFGIQPKPPVPAKQQPQTVE